MKYKILSIISFFMLIVFPVESYALEEVSLVNCTSPSNIWVNINGESKRIHLIGIETPSGALDEEISSYFCSAIKNSSKLEIEYEGEKLDKYNRTLVHLYLDGKLFQEDLLSRGYAYVDNIISYYSKTSTFCEIEKSSIAKRNGIWTYQNIKDPYCKNNIEASTTETDKKEIDTKKKNYDISYMILINSGILVLLILMKRD